MNIEIKKLEIEISKLESVGFNLDLEILELKQEIIENSDLIKAKNILKASLIENEG
jgi:hypothetical protein